jgi:CheY-like chemotaxis protein
MISDRVISNFDKLELLKFHTSITSLESRQISSNEWMVGIVDDDSEISMLFTDALRGIDGISIFTFNDSLEALKHFINNKEKYILVICDLMMPGLNGLDLVKKIKKLSPKIRTIITTASKKRKHNKKFDYHWINDDDLKRELRKGSTLLSYSE